MSVYWSGFLVGSMFGVCLTSVVASMRMVVHHWRALRREQRQLEEVEDVTRILGGLHDEPPSGSTVPLSMELQLARNISRSPLAPRHYADDVPAQALVAAEPARGFRARLAAYWARSAPRSPEEVALRAYEAAVLAQGEIYAGSHRSDGYGEAALRALNTATGEFPSLRYLRRGWDRVAAPVPAEVLI